LHINNTALSDKNENINFYLCEKQEVSSAFKPNMTLLNKFPDAIRFHIVEEIKVNTNSLDSELANHEIYDNDFIKMDVQGYELKISNGSKRSLINTIGLEIEVEFDYMYEGQPLFSEIDKYVRDLGFTLYDIRRSYWRRNVAGNLSKEKGQLIFGDALYFKAPEKIIELDGISSHKIIKAVFIYISYGYVDLAFSLISLARMKGIINNETFDDISNFLKKLRKSINFPNFRGKGRIALFLHFLSSLFYTGEWYLGGDDCLGNKVE
jgi:FkbM family methyltransferase